MRGRSGTVYDACVPALLAGSIAATVYLTGVANGGFSPSAWGFSVVFGLAGVVAIVLNPSSRDLSGPQSTYAVGFAVFSAWMAASLHWSSNLTIGVADVARAAAYTLAVAGAVTLWTSCSAWAIRAGLTAGSAALVLISLGSKLAPTTLGYHNTSLAPGRLLYPLGYWNAQGLLAVMASVLCAGIAMQRTRLYLRLSCAAVMPAIAVDAYFTLSRGAVLAGLAAAVVWISADTERRRTVAWLCALTSWQVIALVVAHDEPRLTGYQYSLHVGGAAGALSAALVLCGLASALTVVLGSRLEGKGMRAAWRRPRVIVRWWMMVIAVSIVVLAVGWQLHGLRGHLTSHPDSRMHVSQVAPARVLSFGSNGRSDLWRAAWGDFESHVVSGSGAGTFEQYWLSHRTYTLSSAWVQNLYLQTLAELGLVGLLLLCAALAAPLFAGIRSRSTAGISSLLGAYAAFLVHAAVDWDWEVPTVTLVALWAGAAILAADRRRRVDHFAQDRAPISAQAWIRWVATGALVAVTAGSALGLVGSRDLSRAQAAADRGDYRSAAASASAAHRWQPWSYLPLLQLGMVDRATGRDAAAVRAFRQAVRLDSNRWDAWFALTVSTHGSAQVRALHHVLALNPLAPQVTRLCEQQPIRGCPPHP